MFDKFVKTEFFESRERGVIFLQNLTLLIYLKLLHTRHFSKHFPTTGKQ